MILPEWNFNVQKEDTRETKFNELWAESSFGCTVTFRALFIKDIHMCAELMSDYIKLFAKILLTSAIVNILFETNLIIIKTKGNTKYGTLIFNIY